MLLVFYFWRMRCFIVVPGIDTSVEYQYAFKDLLDTTIRSALTVLDYVVRLVLGMKFISIVAFDDDCWESSFIDYFTPMPSRLHYFVLFG